MRVPDAGRGYAVAFVLLLAAAATLGVAAAGSLRSVGLLQASALLSLAATGSAVVTIRALRRRP